MTKFSIVLAGIATATVGTLSAVPAAAAPAPAYAAQRWQTINQRQANLDRRIDQGVRNGALTRPEAARLRTEFRNLAGLEYRYRRSGGGLSVGERRDLDRRFDALSARVYVQKNDRQDRRWR